MTEITSKLSTALADRYQIERHLGEGGMATVYLAEDLKHKRKVALKVLRPELAAVLGAERFVQEITTTANLQHPHILPLFDSGEADSFLYYVMPFIDGETLRDKLNRETQLGIEEAVGITTDIAGALDYAHSQGVIHRDIKPENILIHNGRPMVADFGIALAVSAAAGGRMTETGLSLGTPHYMSPEQATAEKDLTARSDVYSLGSVLYEMLTGEPPHMGNSAQQIIMKIVTDTPRPVTELRKSVPPNVTAAVAKALERLAADRFESAAKFAAALTDPSFTLPTVAGAAVASRAGSGLWNRVSVLGWGFAAVVILVALWGWLRPIERPLTRVAVSIPEGEALGPRPDSRIVVSPDGSRLIYVGLNEGQIQLFVRPRDRLSASPIPGTEGAWAPFISPDGQRVAYFTFGPTTLRVVSLTGGPPVAVVDSGIQPLGGTWAPDDFLYLDSQGGLGRVPIAGGPLEPVTVLDTANGETRHIWPDALPNGKGVIFSVRRGVGNLDNRDIAVLDLATGQHEVLARGVFARYSPSGHLLIVTADGTLLGAPFDQGALQLTGPATALVEGLRVTAAGAADLTVSTDGRLFYATGQTGSSEEIVWVDRDGTARAVDAGWTGNFSTLALSPDGRRLAVSIRAINGPHDLWVKQLDAGPLSRLTFDGDVNYRPSWSWDGGSILFLSNRAGQRNLYQKRWDGSATAELVLDIDGQLNEGLWSRDHQWLVYRTFGTPTRDIFGLRPGRDSVPAARLDTEFQEVTPALSPDGRWLAYASDESGRNEVYVRPFPDVSGAKWQVSSDGGTDPLWSHAGTELFFRSATNDIVAAEVLSNPTFAVGEKRTLFSAATFAFHNGHRAFDITPDDQRFIMIRRLGQEVRGELILVEDWFRELRAKVGN